MYDVKYITKLKKYNELTPDAMKAFKEWNAAVFKDGALPAKTKSLMAVAVALTTQCVYCIDIHTKKAKEAGATEQELAESAMVSAALRAGGSITHGLHCLE
jgi:AhpD family alkylhydroperoxidase